MKKLFSLLAIICIIAVSNCTRIPENNDPILGIWSKTASDTGSKEQVAEREEWIFNDAYLGRYHRYSGKTLTFYTDFAWSVENHTYSIIYNEANLSDTEVIMNNADEPEQLEFISGGTFAVRQ
ncbi:hypothetical protein MTsPCn5_28380 [Croceitalea sp. MTPC5]|uniref:hypothetical protein n=1 Tax=Croceitalea sp. MTPC5 TaxID=3056565 RepID=UPI002B3A2CF2|nr:hypothetical protein MTsPCn5_28380 [Croceitalea sp. MTPC5]